MKLSINHNTTFRFLMPLLLICLGLACLAPVDSCAAEPQPPRRKVLVLYSWHDRLPWQVAVSTGLQERLQQEPEENRPDMYEVHLDSVRIKDPAMDGVMYAYLKNKFASVRFDAVITESTYAALFVQRHPDLFPKEKLFAVNFKQDLETTEHALAFRKDDDKALWTILQVMPDRERLVVVVGDSAEARKFKANLAALAPELGVPLEIVDTFTFEELYSKARNLPPRSAILYFPTQRDRNGVLKTPRDVVKQLSAIANAPVFVHHDTLLGTGAVGGYVISARREGGLIGRIALGAPLPASVAEIDAQLNEYMFDSDQLQRWGIPDGLLPAPHKLINHKLSLWETHPRQIVAVLAAILCEALLIAALLYYSYQRKKMVSLLAEERDLLEQRVQERSLELWISNEQLQQELVERDHIEKVLQEKNSELERFAYTVSHDLKSPLVTIKSFSGSIKQDLASGRYDRAEKDLDRICTAAGKMTALLDSLLKLSRSGQIIDAPEPVNMARLVGSVLADMAGTLKENNIRVDVQPGLPTVMCDRQRMMEVVQNLVENAVKYRGEQPELRICIGVRDEEGRQVFFVQDNGPGINPKYHDNIFGLFNRLETRIPGTGIGLALVKRIIETHGGKVWVESDGQGNGSTFCFTVG